MTPEQRLDRAEYILVRLAKSGREARTEFRQKINILINAQMDTDELIKGLAVGQARLNYEMAELAKSQRLTDQALRAFIKSSRKRENGES
jgi:hypothetical protein